MPFHVDIPDGMFKLEKKDDFISWLSKLPVSTWVRRDLIRAWQGQTNVKFSAEEYRRAGL